MTDEEHKKTNEIATEVFFGLAYQQDFKDEVSSEYKVNLIGEMYGRMLMAEWLGYNTSDIGSDARAGIDRLLSEVESFLAGEGEEKGNGDDD